MIKILVDRVRPTTKEIKNRQNFDSILEKASVNETKKMFPWYYGAFGLASFVLAIVTILL
jgi:hypothetical protein